MPSIAQKTLAIAFLIHTATALVASAQRPSMSSPSTPEQSLLKREIELHESRAASFAQTIRKLKKENLNGRNNVEIAGQEQQLQTSLNGAFNAKIGLEELQVKELQKRLRELELQVAQRKHLREQIITHRRDELLNSETLHWDVPDAEQRKTNESPVASSGNTEARCTAVEFREPRGLHVQISGASSDLVAPARMDFDRQESRSQRFTLGFTRLTDLPEGVQFAAFLDTYPTTASTTAFVERHPVPIAISDDDVSQANNDLVLKYFYVSRDNASNKVESKTFYMSRLLPGSDPQAVVEKLGTVVVALQFSRQFERLGATPPPPKSIGDSKGFSISKAQAMNAVGELNLDAYRQQFDVLINRISLAKDRVRELQTVYLKDKSHINELREAIGEIAKISPEWDHLLEEVTQKVVARRKETDVENTIYTAKSERAEAVIKEFAQGSIDEPRMKVAIEARNLAKESIINAGKQLKEMSDALNQWQRPPSINEISLNRNTRITDRLTVVRPGAAQAYVEFILGVNLELIEFDELGLWFKAALRVRKSHRQLLEGDLIVGLNGRVFDTFEEAAASLVKPISQSQRDIVFRGGLGGSLEATQLGRNAGPSEVFAPLNLAAIKDATVRFEIRTRVGMSAPEARYVHGTCISPDGLIVVPQPTEALGELESITALDHFNMPAHIVAVSEDSRLLLIKLDPDEPRMFQWVRSRQERPTRNQKLTNPDYDFNSFVTLDILTNSAPETATNTMFEVSESHVPSVRFGPNIPLFTLTGELQGITCDLAIVPPDPPQYFAVPATAWLKLVEKYDRSLHREKTE